jgi:DinB superfamily
MPALHILEQTPAVLRSLLANATSLDLDWQPRPDRWSIGMVLAHLADVEVKGFVSRFRDIVEQDHPFLAAYDQLALFRDGNKFDGRAELDRFTRLRGATLAWLKASPVEAGARTGRHEQLGVISFHQLLNEFAFHDLGHIRQVLELYRSHAFYPKMGVFQSYYNINP